MKEVILEILEKLNMCSLDGNNLILDNMECKILLDYINNLQELKEDYQCHAEDLENQIEEIEDDYDRRIEELQSKIYDLGGSL